MILGILRASKIFRYCEREGEVDRNGLFIFREFISSGCDCIYGSSPLSLHLLCM